MVVKLLLDLYGIFRLHKFSKKKVFFGEDITNVLGKKQHSWLGVGLEISRSLVQFLAGALWSVLKQESLFHIASVHPAAK